MKSQILPMEHESLVSEPRKEGGSAQKLTQRKSTRSSPSTSIAVHIWIVSGGHLSIECARGLAAASLTEMRTFI